jgi:hypothetical protein
MATTLKPWDTYVAEAAREPLELPIGPDETLSIAFPSGRQLRQFAAARDDETALTALIGADGAARLVALSDDAPAGALKAVVADIFAGFGLSGDPLASSS